MKRILSFLLAVVLIVSLVPVRAQAATGGKLVALTFDDGPSKKLTPTLLDGLKERGVNVTFFMLGYLAEDYIDIVRRAYEDGHEIGNHTWDHSTLTKLSTSSVKKQISQTNDVLDTVCGEGTDYLVRPPGGSTNSSVRAAVGAPLIHWSVDTNDWKYREYDHVYNHIIDNAYDGAIILCHDIHSTTIPAALDAIDVLLKQGYEFVTVSELFRRRGVALEDGTRYYSCKPNGKDLGAVKKPKITYKAVSNGVEVTISSPSGAPVYYSTDGSKLNGASKVYSGSFVVTKPCTVKAVAAFRMNGGRSDEVSAEIKNLNCSPPVFTFTGGKLKLSTSTKGATIYYTLNGKAVGTGSDKYSGAFVPPAGSVIRAAAGGSMFKLSSEVTAYYSKRGNFFTDVMPGKWYTDAVDQVVEMGLMNGVGGYDYAPNEQLTRGMLLTMLYRSDDGQLSKGWKKTNPFSDVSTNEWYAQAVEWAYRNEIADGYPGNVFKPKQKVTRQEMAQMIANYMEYCGCSLATEQENISSYRDGYRVSDWARENMNAVVSAGLIQGDGDNTLRPGDYTTRAEFCTVLLRMLELKKNMQKKLTATAPAEPPIYILPTETTSLEVM